MKIMSIIIEISGEEIAGLLHKIGTEAYIRKEYKIDDDLHLSKVIRKHGVSGVYDILIYKFVRMSQEE